jgi:hypothetical protein
MRYILVANNEDIDEEMNNLREEECDNLILFNKLLPFFKYEFLQNFKNITVFSRKRSSRTEPLDAVYAGIELIKQNEHKFTRIIFHKHPNSYVDKVRQACVESLTHFGFMDSPKTSFLSGINFKKESKIKSEKSLSSGLIAYINIKMTKRPEDKIILVGFTNKLARKFHDPEAEKAFFEEEIRNGQCFI